MMKKIVSCLLILLFCTACANGYKEPSAQQKRETLAQLKTQQSVEFMRANDYRNAIEAINEAVQANPRYDFAWLMRGIIYQALKVNNQANESFQKALAINPSSSEINNNYGWFLCNSMNNPAQSLTYFDKALADPTYPTPNLAHMNKGICLGKISDFNQAEKELNMAYAMQSDFSEPILEMARIKYLKNLITDAQKYFALYSSRVKQLSANALLLGWRISKSSGNTQAAYEYEVQLRTLYPYSDEFKEVISGFEL